MLEITIGITQVDYTDEIDIPIVLRSPLFSEGAGSFIFNFSLPATDPIKKELEYFQRPSRSGAAYIEKSIQIKFGPLTYSGKASISEADDHTYEVSCPIQSGDLANLLKDAKLTSLDLGSQSILDTSIAVMAESELDHLYFDYGPDQFSEVIPLAFSKIIDNSPAGTLAADGKSLSITSPGDILLNLNFKCQVISGLMIFRLYADGVLYDSIELDYNNSELITLQSFSGVLTWDVYVQNSDANTPDTYEIDAELYKGSSISLRMSGSLGDFTDFYPDQNFVLFPFENPGMLSNLPDDVYAVDNFSLKDIYSKYFSTLNYYANGKFPITLSGVADGEHFTVFNLINPFLYIAYVVKAICQEYSITLDNNVFEDNELKRLVLFNLYSENTYLNADLSYINDEINLKNHVPNIDISTFFSNLCKLLGIAYDFDSTNKALKLKYLKDIASDSTYHPIGNIVSRPRLMASPKNGYKLKMNAGSDSYVSSYLKSIADLNYKGEVYFPNQLSGITDQEVNDCYYVKLRKEFWYWNYDNDLHVMNWVFYSGNFPLEVSDVDTSVSEESYEINSQIGSIMNNRYPFRDLNINSDEERRWLIPSTSQPGNFGSPVFKTDYTHAILFYHGLHPDDQGNLYPFASFGNLDLADDKIHTLSLRFDGEDGLYEKRYKKWIDLMLNSRGFWRFQALLSPVQLSQIDFFKWYSDGENRFLLKEIKFNIKKDRVSLAELDVLIK